MGILSGNYDPVQHGVSVSTLSDWMNCREMAKYRLTGVRSKQPTLALTFGSVGHDILQMAHEEIKTGELTTVPTKKKVYSWVARAERSWLKQNTGANQHALEQLEYSLGLIEAVLPMYFTYHSSSLFKQKWVNVEDWFEVYMPVKMYDGKTVEIPLKGKMDGVFRHRGLWLFESKFKSRFDAAQLVDVLPTDLQLLLYCYAGEVWYGEPFDGVLYNIIRRPCLRQKKDESLPDFVARCAEDVENRQDFYFQRLEIVIDPDDIMAFEARLEAMLREFYGWYLGHNGHYRNTSQCENKYGTCWFLDICARNDWSRFTTRDERDGKR